MNSKKLLLYHNEKILGADGISNHCCVYGRFSAAKYGSSRGGWYPKCLFKIKFTQEKSKLKTYKLYCQYGEIESTASYRKTIGKNAIQARQARTNMQQKEVGKEEE